jgi:adenosylhomocysteine nucleosidase
MKVGAVTGLEAEARLARRAGLAAKPSGGIPSQTTAIAESLLRDGADALLSFGIAGALAPSLLPGALLVPRVVVDRSGLRYAVDAAWHAQVIAALGGAALPVDEGDLLGAGDAAATQARKAALFQSTGAVAIDLESDLIAAVAVRANKPFLVLRAIADTAAQALPEAAVTGLAASGKPALGRVLRSVARDPRQIPALIRLARDTRRALDALGSALRVASL